MGVNLLPAGATVLMGATEAALATIGKLVKDVAFTITGERVVLKANTGEEIINSFKNQKATIKAELADIDFAVISDMNSGFMTSANVAGNPVTGATYTQISGAWAVNKFYPFPNQNGDGTIISVTSITGSTDGALVADDDYDIVLNDDGRYGVVFQDFTPAGKLSTLSQNLVWIYDYTPNATTGWTFGSVASTIANKVFQVFYNDPLTGDDYKLTLYKGKQSSDIMLNFLPSDSNEINTYPFEITAEIDLTRTSGDMLGKLVIDPV